MRSILLLLCLASTVCAEWKTARPGWAYEFPRDHGSHSDFKTEWWYFTGNLSTREGREFGYQLTFFRQGIRAPDEDIIPLSRFVTREMKFAHFTLSDMSGGKFRFFQKISRGAYGEAGFDALPRLAWIEDWSCDLLEGNKFRLRAKAEDISLELNLNGAKPVVIHGTDGVSQKADGLGRASHYYSLTRLESEGTLRMGPQEFAVSGQSWFDHEWATNQLTVTQVGWDWFSLQLSDGSEVMLFQIRQKNGGRDSHSAGTFLDPAGAVTALKSADFSLEPTEIWTSPHTGARYPIAWKLNIPRLALRLEVRSAMKDQELRLQPVTYWEGAVRVKGEGRSGGLTGNGYLEMTGYAGPIAGMQTGK